MTSMGKTILALTICLFISGCNSDNFVGVCKVSTGAIGVKTLAVELGVIDKPAAITNVAVVKTLELCIDGWHASIINGGAVSPEQIACAINCMNQLNKESAMLRPAVEKELQAEYGVSVKISSPATPDEIESAYKMFKDTCSSYYWAVSTIYETGDNNSLGLKRRNNVNR